MEKRVSKKTPQPAMAKTTTTHKQNRKLNFGDKQKARMLAMELTNNI